MYVAREGDDGLFVLRLDSIGGEGAGGNRSTLVDRGAIVMWSSIPGDRFAVAGIVADPVAAVRVGTIPAAVQSNAFTATIPVGALDVITVTSLDGERQVRRPPLGL